MGEELLKVIIHLFSIVARERITEDERNNIKEFLGLHLNQEAIPFYLQLFDRYCEEYKPEVVGIGEDEADADTLVFVDDWARISEIGKTINQGLTHQQKLILILKIIELVLADGEISERQSNLIFYIGEIIKVNQKNIQRIEEFVRGTDEEELNSSKILIIDDGIGESDVKNKHLQAKSLTGLIAILRIAENETYFIKYLGISVLTLNGVPLKSRQISVFPTGATIRGDKINSIYYSDVVGSFLDENEGTRLTFQAKNISYKFSSGDIGLRNINISEDGGKLVGVMGASGSGKSTLMNVLNGSEFPSEGKVLINGIDIHKEKEKIEGVIGFVPQDDFLIEDLTVYQNLYFSAKLCFDNYDEGELHKLVIQKLKILGLQETKDLKVGSPLDKTISGGQRKRLNIGLELLREPAVLFVDEPTSGLSSRDSENIMDLLKELSLRGKMIFVVIHQPSSDIYKMFDSMVILDVGGFQIYYGNPLEAVVYFKTRVNMVNKDQSACMECGNVNAEQVFTIIENKVVNEFGRFTEQRKISPVQWNNHFSEFITLPKVKKAKGKVTSNLSLPNKFRQFKIFANRDVLSKLANRQYMMLTFLEAPLLSIFLSYLIRYYVQLEDGVTGYVFMKNDNLPIYFFMAIIVAIFMGLTVSAEEILRDRKILKRESFLNLSRFSYLIAKTAILFAISAIQAGAFVIIGNAFLELHDMHLSLWLVLFTVSCFANMAGLNISSSFNSAVTIYILIPLLIIPQLVLSGVVVTFDKFNPSVATSDKVPWFGDVMPSRWAFEAAMVKQFRDNRFESFFYEMDKAKSNADFKKDFFIPELLTKLTNVSNYIGNKQSGNTSKIERDLRILRNEIENELKLVGRDKYSDLDKLTLDKFDSVVLKNTKAFISKLKNYYSDKSKEARDQKEAITDRMTNTDEKESEFLALMSMYTNEGVSKLVKNSNTLTHATETDERIIQKIDPIFTRPDHVNIFDYRAQFYSPEKYFLGSYYDTYWFNISVIWMMSLILGITLYFNVFRSIVQYFENISIRERRKKLLARFQTKVPTAV